MLGRAGEPGIMALTLNDLFAKMEENKEDSQYHVTMAYLEVCVCVCVRVRVCVCVCVCVRVRVRVRV